jgi:RHS repeat-associated protein
VGALLQIADHSTGKTYLPAYDGNGNVAALFDASDGTVAAAYEYSPYGESLRCEGTFARENSFRFSTKFTDDETGLVYYGRRYYSPSQGRFLGRDPIEEQGGLNLYGFCGNSPIDRWDLLGTSDALVVDQDGSPRPSAIQVVQEAAAAALASRRSGTAFDDDVRAAFQRATADWLAPNRGVPANVSSQGYTVLVVSEAAQLPGGQIAHDYLNTNHQWLAVYKDGQLQGAAGLGNLQGVPGANGQSVPDPPYVAQTYVVDHSGRMNGSGISTQVVMNVDPTAVLSYVNLANVNRNQGAWSLGTNDCNTWVQTVIQNSTPQWIELPQIRAPSTPYVPVMQQVVYPGDGTRRPPVTVTGPGGGG